jgi:uncharacterized protein YaiE (UPF0345 family)
MIDQLDRVSLKLKANIYFDGGVVSHSLTTKKGAKQTVGIIWPGEYHFNTDAPERMDIIAGSCRVKLAGEKTWTPYKSGQMFKVPGKTGFDIAVDQGLAEYLCSFE